MRFTIITVTLNSEKYLKQTLDSVASQDFKNYEHIIWDGGSSDSTLKIAKNYPVKIICGKDRGISDAMNLGANHAQGEFLLHLHSDDCLAHSNVLSRVDQIISNNPNCQWLYGQTQSIDEKGTVIKLNSFVPFSNKKLKKYNIVPHPATFVAKNLFFAVKGFDVGLRYCMDYDLWLRLSQNTNPISIPEVFSSFREHFSSLSTSQPLAVTDEAYKVRNRYLSNFWDRWNSYRTWKKRRKKILMRQEG